jgi:UDP-N-acetylmuramate dehydrogenase
MTQLPSGLAIEEGVSLKPLTSWLVGGPAQFFAQPKTVEELREAMAWAALNKQPATILGGGTNVLISDKGIKGLAIALRKMAGVTATEQDGRLKLDCLAGTSKSELLKNFIKRKLEPALFLAGLPGDVGGGVVMNAGVGEMMKPREFVEIVDWIEVLRWPSVSSGDIGPVASQIVCERIAAGDLKWTYRHCEGWRPGVISRVGLSWIIEAKEDVLTRVKSANQVRLSKQPLDMPSCGSVFVNPPGHTAGRLVEAAGLKGFAVGGAKVSEKHANFIVNFNDAKAVDVHGVIEKVKATVLEKLGVALRTEVVYVGEW